MSTQVSHRVDRGRCLAADTNSAGAWPGRVTPGGEVARPERRPRARDREPSGPPREVRPARTRLDDRAGHRRAGRPGPARHRGLRDALALFAGARRAQPEYDPGVRRRFPVDLGPRLLRVLRISDLKDELKTSHYVRISKPHVVHTFAAMASCRRGFSPATSGRRPSAAQTLVPHPGRTGGRRQARGRLSRKSDGR